LLLLIYYRLYLTQEFLTLLFKHQHKSSISRNIKQVRELFEAVLPTHARALHKVLSLAAKEESRRRKRISSIEEFREAYPELTFIIDGVEQEKRKPQKKEKRKSDKRVLVDPATARFLIVGKDNKKQLLRPIAPERIASRIQSRSRWGNFFRAMGAGMATQQSTSRALS
jgi:hypothetical protein